MGEERTDFISYIIILVEEIEKFLKTQQDFFIFLYKIILWNNLWVISFFFSIKIASI